MVEMYFSIGISMIRLLVHCLYHSMFEMYTSIGICMLNLFLINQNVVGGNAFQDQEC